MGAEQNRGHFWCLMPLVQCRLCEKSGMKVKNGTVFQCNYSNVLDVLLFNYGI